MKRVTRNGVIAVAAASGAMAVAVPAWADSGADGTAAGAPGVISGNDIQLPVHVPVSGCGNTVNVVGFLNPAAGNSCGNQGGGDTGQYAPGGSAASGGASAQGAEEDSGGVISGNGIQLPADLPVNVGGNSVNVVGVHNPAIGNTSGDHPEPPADPHPRAAHRQAADRAPARSPAAGPAQDPHRAHGAPPRRGQPRPHRHGPHRRRRGGQRGAAAHRDRPAPALRPGPDTLTA